MLKIEQQSVGEIEANQRKIIDRPDTAAIKLRPTEKHSNSGSHLIIDERL